MLRLRAVELLLIIPDPPPSWTVQFICWKFLACHKYMIDAFFKVDIWIYVIKSS